MIELAPAPPPVVDRMRGFAELEAKAAQLVEQQIAEAVEARGEAALALAGGTTPAGVYCRLAKSDLPWDRVLVTLTDERWVDADSPESNERLIRSTLLTGSAVEARFVPLKDGHADLENAAKGASVALAAASWPLDLVLLGMGEDGHFASLFPGNPALGRGLDPAAPLCIPVPASEPAPHRPRLSLSLPAVLDSRLILVLIRGEAKGAVLATALDARADPKSLPIAAVLHQTRTPVRVFWSP